MSLHRTFGDPSKVFKYDNYAAIHYTFFFRISSASSLWLPSKGEKQYCLRDYLIAFFPDDTDMEYCAVAERNILQQDKRPTVPDSIQHIHRADLSALYKNNPKTAFLKCLEEDEYPEFKVRFSEKDLHIEIGIGDRRDTGFFKHFPQLQPKVYDGQVGHEQAG